jgi:ABC-type multidrug transport system fused ATPase/permease subunit
MIDSFGQSNAAYQKLIADEKAAARLLVMVRLLLFIGTVVLFLLLIKPFPLMACGLIPAVAFIFLLLLRREIKISRRIRYLENRIHINQREIDLLNQHFEKFHSGKEFQDPAHPFASDLDVFGNRSVFQLLNRSTSKSGIRKLASWLLEPLTDASAILVRQHAVKELVGRFEWMQHFLAIGMEKKTKEADTYEINHWLKEENHFSGQGTRWLGIILPVLTVLGLSLYLGGLISGLLFTASATLQMLYSLSKAGRVRHMQDQLSRKFDTIQKYAGLIALIEETSFDSEALQKIQEQLRLQHKKSSEAISDLKKLSDALDLSHNLILAVLLNTFLLWNINVARRIECWRALYKNDFEGWLDAIAALEAFISLACHTHIHPEHTFPEPVSGSFFIDAENTGHPLIAESKLVKNNFKLTELSRVVLLTGANMAGKSTFLRTIGVNLCLAMTGAPVCASSFRFSPIRLFTSLRTNDSLQANESFFYAELKRLHSLILLYEAGTPVFFLLDEILKGTNSKDQHAGSVALIKKVMRLEGSGIIATHDIALASLAEEMDGKLINLCFEIRILGEQLEFDYLLRPGVCQQMNASFLLKKMGISD